MKKKAFRHQQHRARKLFNWWERALGLRWWRLEYRWHAEDSAPFVGHDGKIVLARATAHWQYLDLFIDVNTPELAGIGNDHLEYTAVHELCHALVNEMREPDPDGKHEERVVTQLAKAFIWVRDLTREDIERERGIWGCVREMLENALETDYVGMKERIETSIELLDGLEDSNDGPV